jgi:putative flippase GtrA
MVFKLPANRLVRFLLIGALNSIFGFCVFSAMVLLGTGNLPALFAGNLAGLVFNFFSTGGLVFRSLTFSAVPRFVLCYVAVLTLNTFLLGWLAALAGDRILAQALLTLPMAVMSYLVMSHWVFRGAGNGQP